MAALRPNLTPEQITEFDDHYRAVRVKPYDAKKNHLRVNINYGGVVFKGGPNPQWSQVTIDQANELASEHQYDGDETSPKVFDICTYDEYRKLDQLERRVKLGVASQQEVAEFTGEPELRDSTGRDKPKVSFAGVKPLDKALAEPRGAAIPSGSGDLTSEEVRVGESRSGPQRSAHPNRKAVADENQKASSKQSRAK